MDHQPFHQQGGDGDRRNEAAVPEGRVPESNMSNHHSCDESRKAEGQVADHVHREKQRTRSHRAALVLPLHQFTT
jgi:hypothetical protein